MEEISLKETVKHKEVVRTPDEVESATPDSITNNIQEIDLQIKKQEEIITTTTLKVNEIRAQRGLSGQESDIPSLAFNDKKKNELENKKISLEKKLQELLKSDVSEKYRSIIDQAKQSKIDWAHSEELARRLRLKGASAEDVAQVKDWLVNNTVNAKTFVLSPNKFKEVVDILYEMTGEENIKEGSAFHVPGGRTDVPDSIKSSLFVKERNSPPVPGKENTSTHKIDINELHHEFGHVAQDGLLQSELYKDWEPKFKDGAPDKEYVGLINETDTKIRSMFRDLDQIFDPQKEVFGKKHLEILKDKIKKGQINKDTKDLFDHYDDISIIKMANRMPAI